MDTAHEDMIVSTSLTNPISDYARCILLTLKVFRVYSAVFHLRTVFQYDSKPQEIKPQSSACFLPDFFVEIYINTNLLLFKLT